MNIREDMEFCPISEPLKADIPGAGLILHGLGKLIKKR